MASAGAGGSRFNNIIFFPPSPSLLHFYFWAGQPTKLDPFANTRSAHTVCCDYGQIIFPLWAKNARAHYTNAVRHVHTPEAAGS